MLIEKRDPGGNSIKWNVGYAQTTDNEIRLSFHEIPARIPES